MYGPPAPVFNGLCSAFVIQKLIIMKVPEKPLRYTQYLLEAGMFIVCYLVNRYNKDK